MLFKTKAVGYYKLTYVVRTFFAKIELRIEMVFNKENNFPIRTKI